MVTILQKGFVMRNMIVQSNKIKYRRYNLFVDGEIVEVMLSARMANTLADAYRQQGFAVDKVEVFTLTNSFGIVGDTDSDIGNLNSPTYVDPNEFKQLLTPAATDKKIKRDRDAARIKFALRNKNRKPVVRYINNDYRNRNSLLHSDYLAAIRKNGYRVYNKDNGDVWIGLEKEIANRIFSYMNSGGSKSNLDIKFIGKE